MFRKLSTCSRAESQISTGGRVESWTHFLWLSSNNLAHNSVNHEKWDDEIGEFESHTIQSCIEKLRLTLFAADDIKNKFSCIWHLNFFQINNIFFLLFLPFTNPFRLKTTIMFWNWMNSFYPARTSTLSIKNVRHTFLDFFFITQRQSGRVEVNIKNFFGAESGRKRYPDKIWYAS